MKKLFILIMIVLISTAAGVGCSDNDNSGSSNTSGDTGVADTGDNSTDAGGDTGGDTGGQELLEVPTANSGAYASTTLQGPGASGTFFLSLIAISDHQDMCSTIPDTCDGSITDEEGTVLALQLLTDEEQKTGRYDLGQFDEEAFTTGSLVAKAQLDALSDDTSDIEPEITQGYVDVTAFDDQHIAGTYELTVDGTVETGSFDVDFCQKLADDLACE